MTTMLELTCRDPIVSRDGSPFGAGQGTRMRSTDWVLPSVVAGSLHSTIGKAAARDFSLETAQDLLQVEVHGVFPQAEGTLYLPAPHDCVVHPRTPGEDCGAAQPGRARVFDVDLEQVREIAHGCPSTEIRARF
jgi:hypothetical protein